MQTTPSNSHRSLLRLPGAAAFFIAAGLGRTGIAATGLGLVWLMTRTHGSYAAAGVVVGAFAVAEALLGPQVARAVDRFGQTRVLPCAALVHAAAVVGVLVAAAATAPQPLLVAAAAAAGGSVPQLGALSSARWAALLHDRRERLPQAFALESLANAVAFLVGPVLVSAVAVSAGAWVGSLVAAALVVAGSLALAAQPRTAPQAVPRAARPAASTTGGAVEPGSGVLRAAGLLSHRFVLVVIASALLGVHFGGVQLAVTAWARQSGSPGVATALFAASSGAGLVGAWAYGLRRWRATAVVQLIRAAAVLLAGCAVMVSAAAAGQHQGLGPAAASLAIGAGLVVTGVVVPVVIVQLTVLVERGSARAVLTHALTWTNSASAAGSAAAGALAGGAIDAAGAGGGFAVLAAVSGCLLLVPLTGQRWLR